MKAGRRRGEWTLTVVPLARTLLVVVLWPWWGHDSAPEAAGVAREIAGERAGTAARSADSAGNALMNVLLAAATEKGWQVRFADSMIEETAEAAVVYGDFGRFTPDQVIEVALLASGLGGELIEGTLVIDRAGGVKNLDR